MGKIKSPGFYQPMDIAPGEYIVCPDCKGKRIVSSGKPYMRDGHACFTCQGTGTVLAEPPINRGEDNQEKEVKT